MPNKRDPNKIRVQTWVTKEDKPPLMIDKSNASAMASPPLTPQDTDHE